MCAISGIWRLDARPVTREGLIRFTDAMTHRGPDGSGYWVSPNGRLGLGHRRLAILDCTEQGAQPMDDPAKARKIVFNGEIYNFIELRRELEALGYAFHSQTDTEVILHAFDAWGTACLERFNGMWAFAIWDECTGELFLARDRFGVKPLHFLHREAELFAFASETLAFKDLEGFRREIDPARLATGIENVFRLEGAGETLFRGIRQLLPGHYAIFNGRDLRLVRWWNTVERLSPFGGGYAQAVEEFRNLFESACRLRLRSDVPIGSALSGGLDSSAVVGMLRALVSSHDVERLPESWQTAFIHSMPGSALDETAYARQVVEHVRGNAVIFETDSKDLPGRICETTRKLDFVYLTPGIMTDLYQRMRQAGVVVSLDGHGVDEMLYGYPDLVELAWRDAMDRGDRIAAKDLASTLIGTFPIDRRKTMAARLRAYGKSEPFWKKWFARKAKSTKTAEPASWLKVAPAQVESPNYALMPERFSPSERALYMNFHEWILPTLLRNYDRAAMLAGVEIRMPFMDWRLATFVFGLPESAKVGHGFTKRILRDSIRGFVPESIRTRTIKIGWNAPMHEWFQNELRDWIMDEFSSRAFLESEIWDGPAVRDFAATRMQERSWTFGDCSKVWPYLNAHILLS